MEEKLSIIEKLEEDEMDAALAVVRKRYSELFPEQELALFTLCKNENRNVQIDRVISLLQKIKEQ